MVSKFLKSKTGHEKRKSTFCGEMKAALHKYPPRNYLTLTKSLEFTYLKKANLAKGPLKWKLKWTHWWVEMIHSHKQAETVRQTNHCDMAPKTHDVLIISRIYKTYLSVCLVSKSIKNLFHSDNFSRSSIYRFPDNSICL